MGWAYTTYETIAGAYMLYHVDGLFRKINPSCIFITGMDEIQIGINPSFKIHNWVLAGIVQ
jgi:hypothetical protein